MRHIVVFAKAGCLLPVLIVLNLFFGWMFFKPLQWFLIEGLLVLLSIANFFLFAKKIASFPSKRDNIIDIQGEVIKEEKPQGSTGDKNIEKKSSR